MFQIFLTKHIIFANIQMFIFALIFAQEWELHYFVWSLFIYWFVSIKRWCIDKLGNFHANKIALLFTTPELRVTKEPFNIFKPTGNFLYRQFQGIALLWILFVIDVSYLSIVMLSCLFLAALRSFAGKGMISCVLCFLVLFLFVTIQCGVPGQVWNLIALIPINVSFCYFLMRKVQFWTT